MTSGLSDEALLRMVVAQVPALAERAVDVPTKRLGVVVDNTEAASSYVDVDVDGDIIEGVGESTAMMNATGGPLAAGQRVVVDFYPPNGAMVSAVVAPRIAFSQVFTNSFSVPSSDASTTTSGATWVEVTEQAAGWAISGSTLVCEAAGLWRADIRMLWPTDGDGTVRAAALNSASVQFANVSAQFTGPGGVPTAGFGLSAGAPGFQAFDVGDTITAQGRHDGGTSLTLIVTAHMQRLR